MTIEGQVENQKWHADKTEIGGAIGSVGLLVAGHFPIFGEGAVYAAFALMVALTDLAVLRSKAENVARSKKQNNPSRQLPM